MRALQVGKGKKNSVRIWRYPRGDEDVRHCHRKAHSSVIPTFERDDSLPIFCAATRTQCHVIGVCARITQIDTALLAPWIRNSG